MNAYCVDLEKHVVTKSDCSCAPKGLNCQEFALESEDREAILSRAKEVSGLPDLILCEHF